MTERKKFEHISTRPVPYTTKTGIQIGIAYQPKPQRLTQDGEFIQSVLLGSVHSVYPNRHIIGNVLYTVAMVSMIFGLVVLVAK